MNAAIKYHIEELVPLAKQHFGQSFREVMRIAKRLTKTGHSEINFCDDGTIDVWFYDKALINFNKHDATYFVKPENKGRTSHSKVLNLTI